MYLFPENVSATGVADAPPAACTPCEHWAEGAYALFVAHQFKIWTEIAVTWCGALYDRLPEPDPLD